MEITGNELIEFINKSMTDENIVKIIDSFGWEQPMIDEQYEEDLYIAITDAKGSGISFVFEEINGYTKNGELYLSQVSFAHDKIITAPFELNFTDNYLNCSSTLQKKADYKSKLSKKIRIWTLTTEDNMKYMVAINFIDKDLSKIKGIVVSQLMNDSIDENMIENKD